MNKLNENQESSRLGHNIKRGRAAVGPDVINSYNDVLEKIITDVLAENIVNYDETNFSDDPGKVKVLIKIESNHPENVLNSSNTSVMMAGSTSSVLLPPYVVYKLKHLYPTHF